VSSGVGEGGDPALGRLTWLERFRTTVAPAALSRSKPPCTSGSPGSRSAWPRWVAALHLIVRPLGHPTGAECNRGRSRPASLARQRAWCRRPADVVDPQTRAGCPVRWCRLVLLSIRFRSRWESACGTSGDSVTLVHWVHGDTHTSGHPRRSRMPGSRSVAGRGHSWSKGAGDGHGGATGAPGRQARQGGRGDQLPGGRAGPGRGGTGNLRLVRDPPWPLGVRHLRRLPR
jgi:hypothetical protein